MKRKPTQIFLVIAISLSIFVSSIYCQYYSLASADFISIGLKLENFDQEYLSALNQSELKVAGSGDFLRGFQPVTCLFGHSFHLLSHEPFLDQQTSILRC